MESLPLAADMKAARRGRCDMGYLSGKCVTCTEKTKRYAGEYSGNDEDGKRFRGHLYCCKNKDCEINCARVRARKAMIRYS